MIKALIDLQPKRKEATWWRGIGMFLAVGNKWVMGVLDPQCHLISFGMLWLSDLALHFRCLG